jgi:predicted acetylornithine/succinylornithine family transaminase
MGNKQIISRDQKSILPTYARNPVALAKGKGAYVWDEDGKRYLDLMTGISVNNLGHAHPGLTKAIAAQAGKLNHASNLFYQKTQVELAEALRQSAPFASHVAFANTGAEANELLIKFARRFGHASGRHEILAFHGGFHGRTYGALSASGQVKLHKGMEPLLPGFRHVPYNDLDAARKAVNRHTAAILVEPIQGENGIVVGTDEFLVGLRRLCDRQGLLLMLDEIQTGLGRTGEMYAFEHLAHDCVPDLMSLGKSLGGGLPLSAVLASERAAAAIGLGQHGTTLGGNPIACAAGLALLKELKAKKLPQNAAKVGQQLIDGLKALQAAHPGLIKQVRGRGLMLAIQLSQPSKPIQQACLELGLIVNSTADTVLRLLPPLNLTPAQAKDGLAILASALLKAAVKAAPAAAVNPKRN